MTRNALLFPLALLLPIAAAATGCDAAGRARSDAHHREMERRMLELEMRVDTLEAENRVLRTELLRRESERGLGADASSGASPGATASSFSARCTETKDGYAITRDDVEAIAADMNGFAAQARVIPNFENGKATGFKLFGIRPRSIYESCGFRNGDVVSKVNGMDFTSPDKALQVYSGIREAKTLEVEVVRGGKPARVKIEITGS